jgi:chemotaxis signal transduction protein
MAQVAGAPPEVAGVAVVRGRSVPVLRLAGLFDDGKAANREAARWVTLREPKAPVLAVDEVERVFWLDAEELDRAELLSEAAAGAVARLGALDRQILVCLETARIVEAVDLPQSPPSSGESPSEVSP